MTKKLPKGPTLHLNLKYGKVVCRLFQEIAPNHVKRIIELVEEKSYDNVVFHRVIDGFMVQGGGFTEDMQQKDTKETIENEANNGLSNVTGSIAMARTSAPHSASSQFFINVNDNTFLDFKSESMQGWGYCVFGQVVEGMDVVNKIKNVSTGNRGMHQDVPLEAVIIEKVTVA